MPEGIRTYSKGKMKLEEGQGGGDYSETRGVFGGGTSDGNNGINIVDYVTIASTGNATDFGDLTQSRYDLCGCSSAHGGLS